MTTIFSRYRRISGVAAVMAAGLALAACAGPLPDSPARYARNLSPGVMSDAVPSHRAIGSLDGETCAPDTQTFAADCGGFVRYDGP